MQGREGVQGGGGYRDGGASGTEEIIQKNREKEACTSERHTRALFDYRKGEGERERNKERVGGERERERERER